MSRLPRRSSRPKILKPPRPSRRRRRIAAPCRGRPRASMEEMHDLAFFRTHFDQIAERLATRGGAYLNLDRFRELDRKRRAAITEAEQLKARKNAGERGDRQAEARRRRYHRAPAGSARHGRPDRRARRGGQGASTTEFRELLAGIPNMPHESVPVGATAEDNVEVRRCGRAHASSISNPRRTGTSARSSASSISSAPPRSPARASPSTGAWAPGWNARSSTSCSTCTPASTATPRCCRRSW